MGLSRSDMVTMAGVSVMPMDTTERVILFILTVGTILGVVRFVATDGVAFLTWLTQLGVIKSDEKTYFGGIVHRAQRAALLPTLKAVGLDGYVARDVRLDLALEKNRQRLDHMAGPRPDIDLLRTANQWIIYSPDQEYFGNKYYWDLQEASYGRAPRRRQPLTDDIMTAWIERLKSSGRLDPFDVLLAPKIGNVILAQRVAERLHVELILYKSDSYSSKSMGPDITDFEGLNSYIRKERQEALKEDDYTYRALLFDDSCRGGRKLVAAANRFNELIEQHSDIRFMRITEAVVLLHIKSSNEPDPEIRNHSFKVHALISAGDDEMAQLKSNPSRAKFRLLVKSCKEDTSCDISRDLFIDA